MKSALGLGAASAMVAVMALGTVRADAADLEGVGWWTASPLPVSVDADEGLVVQGGPDPDRPFAFAAVHFSLKPDETPVSLTMTIATSSVSTPTAELVACPLADTFEPASGASMDEAPGYDCDVSVTATPDGTRYLFPLGELAEMDRVAVAILPSLPTDRVVLETPDETALRTLTPGNPTTESPGEVTPPPTRTTNELPAPTTVSPNRVAPDEIGSFPAPDVSPPAESVPKEENASDENVTVGPREDLVAAELPPIAVEQGVRPLAALAFAGLTTAAAVLWFRAGRRDPATEGVDPNALVASA